MSFFFVVVFLSPLPATFIFGQTFLLLMVFVGLAILLGMVTSVGSLSGEIWVDSSLDVMTLDGLRDAKTGLALLVSCFLLELGSMPQNVFFLQLLHPTLSYQTTFVSS